MRTRAPRATLRIALGLPLTLLALMLGCGGGGGADTATSTPNPTSDAGADGEAGPEAGGVTCVGRSIVLTRHAEKGDGSDPSLTAEGKARAERLAGMFANETVTRLVATEFKRTQETLAPLAERTGLPVNVQNAAGVDALAEDLAKGEEGSFVIVAGHSNTVPELVSALGGGSKPTIDEAEYSRVFVLRYGCDEPTPTVTELSSD